jgi:hypothetical protein
MLFRLLSSAMLRSVGEKKKNAENVVIRMTLKPGLQQ